MSRYKAYPEYKDSGVEWLGKVPQTWHICNLKHFANITPSNVDKKSLPNQKNIQLCNYTDVYYNDFISNKVQFMAATASDEQIKRFTLRAGDTLITKDSETADDIAIAAYVPETLENVLCGYHLAIVRPKISHSGSFIKWLFDSIYTKSSVAIQANGLTRVGLSQYALDNLVFALPSTQEKIAISTFLDHETKKIDQLITKQKQLIELLKEKRQAVISHAVTKGLNPNVKMKNSGIEWLGEMPEHWVVKRAKTLFSFITSGSRGWAEFYSDDGNIFFRIANLTRDTIEPKFESIQCVSPPNGSEGERSKIIKNDILISITADLGSVCVANSQIENAYVSQHVSLCRPKKEIRKNARWLGYVILSNASKEQFIGAGYGGTKVQLSLEDIRELQLAYPPYREQQQIYKFLDYELDRFEKLTSHAENMITLLKERRSALISAAVTGKIDVRDWQAAKDVA
ncbi:hypothetical protein AM629_08005 [Photorhabdus heterorhabditis]|uniref:Type I restriction modification DNA specificity domain-containing protein n=1 Tax=Photorhabdus heterorhabditis TaxID=880156 RepID=A0ABR5KD43_9GAMM|nr:restriction endonuclease subunit S [Photorhabdus heterorhabditis]KOY62508.1 hypothetical protein AM629_08005 [Photorhabdus heterorhabditis]